MSDADGGRSSYPAAGTPEEWPRTFRPLIRRGWWPRAWRRDRPAQAILLVVVLGPLVLVLAIALAPVIALALLVRWTLRKLGAP